MFKSLFQRFQLPPPPPKKAESKNHVPKEWLKKVRAIQIRSGHIVNDILAGEYHSAFKGSGMDFEEVREYQPGDDVRLIDWNVTARTKTPYIKTFREERELTVLFVFDASSSGKFGTQQQQKSEIAAEICATLALSAITNNDKVGLILFTDRVELFVPPKKGKPHVLRIIRELLFFQPKHSETHIDTALEFLSKVTRRKAVVFLVSDFLAPHYEQAMRIARRKHDLVALQLVDPRELEIPPLGLLELEDMETGELLLIDSKDTMLRQEFSRNAQKRLGEQAERFRSMKVDALQIRTDEDYVKTLIRFFKMRGKRR